jgi:putrescine transport system substrate-binding protein
MSRLRLFIVLLLALGPTLAAAQKPAVSFYNWADYVPADLVRTFEKSSGIKVVYTTFDSNEILDARLRGGKAEFDVVGPRAFPYLAAQLPDNLYQPLDRARLTHYADLDPVIMKLLEKHDPQNSYSVPWMWGTVGIGYNVDRLKKLAPDVPADSLRLLFDPEIVSKFKDCGVMVLDSPAEIFAAALAYLGLDPDSKSEADLVKAADVIRAIRPFIRKYTSSDFVNQLAQGNMCLAFGYSGDVQEARSRTDQAKSRGSKPVLSYAVPREGAQVWIDVLAIPAHAANPDNAYKLLDYLLDPQVAATSSNRLHYASANAAARPLLDPAIAADRGLYPTDDVMAKLYVLSPPERRFEQQRIRLWNAIKSNK